MDELIKDAAITLQMNLVNQAGAEFEDEQTAVSLIVEAIKEMINESKGQ